MEQLRCLVCQGQSIADSDAELAGDMRDLVRRRIAAGEKPATIRTWLIQRYGSWISYRPTAEPQRGRLWLAPLALLLVGALLIRRRIRAEGRQLMGWVILFVLIVAGWPRLCGCSAFAAACSRRRGSAACSVPRATRCRAVPILPGAPARRRSRPASAFR